MILTILTMILLLHNSISFQRVSKKILNSFSHPANHLIILPLPRRKCFWQGWVTCLFAKQLNNVLIDFDETFSLRNINNGTRNKWFGFGDHCLDPGSFRRVFYDYNIGPFSVYLHDCQIAWENIQDTLTVVSTKYNRSLLRIILVIFWTLCFRVKVCASL